MPPRAQLAYAAALSALVALAHAQELCDTMLFGNDTQFAVILAERRVEPDKFTLEISEPDVCSDSEAAGLKVTACDAGQAPRVYLLDTARGMVVRGGSLSGSARVYVTVYCAVPTEIDYRSPESAESPAVAQRYSGETSTVRSISTATALPTRLKSISSPDSLPLWEVKPPSILPSSTDEYLPPVRLESRFSSLDQANGPSIQTSLKSRGQLISPSFLKGMSYRLKENEQPLFDKAKHQPSILDSYSTYMSSSSLYKHLRDLRPKKTPNVLANRSPAWLRRPTKQPSSPFLNLLSLPDGETRKSKSRSRNFVSSHFSEYDDPWTPYEDGPLSLQWTDEPADSNQWYTEGDSQSSYKSDFRIKPPQILDWNEGPYPPLQRPSTLSSIKHDSKKQSRYVPPILEEDPALLAEWLKYRNRSQHPSLTKRLLLLEKNHPAPIQSKGTSAHSVEDNEPWWTNRPYKDFGDEGIPWQPDYPADYTADDGDAHTYWRGLYTGDSKQSPHLAWAHYEERKRGPNSTPASQPHAPPYSFRLVGAKPHVLQKPTLSYKPSWIKSSNPVVPLKSPLKLKQPISKKLMQPTSMKRKHHSTDHHYLSETHNLPDEEYPIHMPGKVRPSEPKYPSATSLPGKRRPSEPKYPPETFIPSDSLYPPEPYYPSESHYPPEPLYPTEPHYPSEPNYPLENHYPSEPHYPSENHYPIDLHYSSEPHYPPEPHYPSENHYPADPDYSSEPHYPPKPHYPTEPHYLSENHYPTDHVYSSEPHYPLEAHYPSENHSPSEPHYPSENYYPTGLHYLAEPHYPPEPHYPSENHYPSEPHYPSENHYPTDPHYSSEPHYPPGPHYPTEAHYPSEDYYPSETHYLTEPHYPIEPHYPTKPHYTSESNYPPEPHYPTQPHYPSEPYYPSEYQYPSEPYYPSEPNYPSENHYPTEPLYPSEHLYPLEPHYPSKPHYPTEPHYPPDPHYPSEPFYPNYTSEEYPVHMPGTARPPAPDYPSEHDSPSPWNFLSELLLSHPSFRDATHVIRIR